MLGPVGRGSDSAVVRALRILVQQLDPDLAQRLQEPLLPLLVEVGGLDDLRDAGERHRPELSALRDQLVDLPPVRILPTGGRCGIRPGLGAIAGAAGARRSLSDSCQQLLAALTGTCISAERVETLLSQ